MDAGIRATVAIDQPNVVEYDKYPLPGRPAARARSRDRMQRAPRHDRGRAAARYRRPHPPLARRGRADSCRGVVLGAAARRPRLFPGCSATESRARPALQHPHPRDASSSASRAGEIRASSLVRYAHDLGVLDERMMVIHAIWIDDDDIELLGGAGCSVAHNPVCNLRIGSGVMPFRRVRDAGVTSASGPTRRTSTTAMNMWSVGSRSPVLIHNVSDPDYRGGRASTSFSSRPPPAAPMPCGWAPRPAALARVSPPM